MTKITYIPGEIANAAIDEHGNRKPVTRTHHIFDDVKNKNQAQINADVDSTFAFQQSEINALNSQNYVTVDSFSSLPTTGAVDTVYRVSNWDGTQQDPSVYSEYAWNGEDYVHLSTKTQKGEVFDISAYHATGGTLATYADLSAALDSNNGGGVPQSLQEGGMSVKFVRTPDNKYVQYMFLLSEFTDSQFMDIENWQEQGGRQKEEWVLENPVAAEYLHNVDYTNNPEYTISYIANYSPVPTDYLKSRPFPASIKWAPSANNTGQRVEVSDSLFFTNKWSYALSSSAHSLDIYNLIPNRKYYWRVYNTVSGNEILIDSGYFDVSGRCRMLYIDGEKTLNFRDLGGWELPDNKHVKYGRLIRGAEIYNLNDGVVISQDGIDMLVNNLGISVELDFGDTPGTVLPNTVEYLNDSQIYGIEAYNNALSSVEGRTKYYNCLHTVIDRLLNGRNVYFHCAVGADRTATFAFLIEALLGISESDLSKDYELTSFYTLRKRNENLSSGFGFPSMIAWLKANYTGQTLQEKVYDLCTRTVENGGIGLSESEIIALRNEMIEEDNRLSIITEPECVQPGSTGIPVGNAIAGLAGYYDENPEFVYVKTDAEGKILWAIKTDGGIYYGAGVPQQVIDYINKKIAELSLDEYEDIVAFLADLEKGDKTLQDLLDKKVDGEYIDNPEYTEVKTDAENKVLEGIQIDGTKVIGGGLNVGGSVKILGNMEVSGVSYKVIENPEYIAAWVDGEEKVVFGLETDGKTYVGDADFLNDIKNNKEAISEIHVILSSINASLESFDIDALSSITMIEHPEYLEVKTDKDDKILSGRTNDGAAFENVGFSTPKASIGGHTIESIEDPEGRLDVKIDKSGKIISYRDSNGVQHEEVGIEVKNIEAKSINARTITAIYGSFGKMITDKTELYVTRPKFATIKLYGNLPTDETVTRHSTRMRAEFIIDDSIIFNSYCDMEIQGHGSVSLAKHNYSIDFLNANEKALSVKFGDMISVDGYHLKGYMTDRSQARGIGCAAVWRDMIKYTGYPYSIVNNKSMLTPANYKADSLYVSDAKYSEDGFPLSLYVNDEFYGLYSLKLKKNRKNYAMEKSVKNEIFLDSITYTAYLNEAFDHTDWEVKNPKLSGYEEGGEITDAAVLANIERLFSFTSDIVAQKDDYADFIVFPHWIAYVVFCELVDHWDVNGNNTELCTWDGTYWSIFPYDMDNTLLDITSGFKMGGAFWETFRGLFEDELKAFYTKLRNNGFISAENLYNYYINQVNSIPRDVYEADYKKWGMEDTDDRYLNIQFIYKALQARIEFLDSVWLLNNN